MPNKHNRVKRERKPAPSWTLNAAREIKEKMHQLEAEGAKLTRELAGGDWFGPSISDYRDGEEKVINEIAKIVQKHYECRNAI